MEFLILFGAIIVGFLAGWNAREAYAVRRVHQILDQLEQVEDLDEEEAQTPDKIRLELHGNVIYAYTVDNDTFIAQGASLEELDAAVQARFPGKKFSIKESNLEEITQAKMGV